MKRTTTLNRRLRSGSDVEYATFGYRVVYSGKGRIRLLPYVPRRPRHHTERAPARN